MVRFLLKSFGMSAYSISWVFYMICFKGIQTKALTVLLFPLEFSQVTSYTRWEMPTFTWITLSRWKYSFSGNQGLSRNSKSFEKLRKSMTSRLKTFRSKVTILIRLLKWKWLFRVLLKELFEGYLRPGKSSFCSKGGRNWVKNLLVIYQLLFINF